LLKRAAAELLAVIVATSNKVFSAIPIIGTIIKPALRKNRTASLAGGWDSLELFSCKKYQVVLLKTSKTKQTYSSILRTQAGLNLLPLYRRAAGSNFNFLPPAYQSVPAHAAAGAGKSVIIHSISNSRNDYFTFRC
jgi:hypothetical protein